MIIDNTFLGPLWQHPLALGCDLAVYSLTKYAGGHSDLVAGSVVGSQKLIQRVRSVRSSLGTMTEPYTCWLLLRSLETLKLRMNAAMENARKVAEFLRGHPKVAKVQFLGFLTPEDTDYALYRRQCEAPGSTFSFDVTGGEAAETLTRIGITPGMVRLSVGVENPDDLIADLGQALAGA